jgi:hypothetical protein
MENLVSRSKVKNLDYCVLFREDKGYYLSKTSIAESMDLNIVEKGDKVYCEKKIDSLNQPEKI